MKRVLSKRLRYGNYECISGKSEPEMSSAYLQNIGGAPTYRYATVCV